jgi:NADH-quinone oxidoreductase subunit M
LVGVLYDRRHTRAIADYGGLASEVPVFAFLFLVFTLSSIALPLTNGFVGEFLILTGSFRAFPALTAVAVLGVILGAVYMLTLYMKTMFGEITHEENRGLADVNRTELACFIPLLILVFVMGVYPQPIISRIEPTTTAYLEAVAVRRQALIDKGPFDKRGPAGGGSVIEDESENSVGIKMILPTSELLLSSLPS